MNPYKLTKYDLIEILRDNNITMDRYEILNNDESLIYHNGKFYTPTHYMYLDKFNGEPNIIDDPTLFKHFLDNFENKSEKIYLILNGNCEFNLYQYFMLPIYDSKLDRKEKLKKLLNDKSN